MERKLASVGAINFPVMEMANNKEEFVNAFLRDAKRAVESDKASCIVLGCMTVAFLLVDEIVKD